MTLQAPAKMVVIIFMHGVRRSALFVFWASTLALQRVFDFWTDGRTDIMRENNDQSIRPWSWWVNKI